MGSYGYRSVNCVQCEVEGKCALGANGALTLTDCDSAGGADLRRLFATLANAVQSVKGRGRLGHAVSARC